MCPRPNKGYTKTLYAYVTEDNNQHILALMGKHGISKSDYANLLIDQDRKTRVIEKNLKKAKAKKD